MNDHRRSPKKFTILYLITKIPFKTPCQVKDILSITVTINTFMNLQTALLQQGANYWS